MTQFSEAPSRPTVTMAIRLLQAGSDVLGVPVLHGMVNADEEIHGKYVMSLCCTGL